jgi:CRISPR-associated exonuclease Cas4
MTVRAMPVKSQTLAITGKCDVVEFIKSDNQDAVYIPQYDGNYTITPIEYKRGKPKEDNYDILQLFAQAYCLEEMLVTQIEKALTIFISIDSICKIE